MKPGKAAGPDGVPMDVIKTLDEIHLEGLTEILNDWWLNKKVPEEMTRAKVVLLFKKGPTADLGNYRPISLLNSIYKVMAAILKARLEQEVEADLHSTQFGFRKGKGTADAIQIIRRIIDKGESTNTKTILTLLDWEKAFDKVTHGALAMALRRMGVSKPLREMIMALFENPEFNVEQHGVTSGWKKQSTGIRQGCPLSPYLCVVIMTVLFRDVKSRHEVNMDDGRIRGICIWMRSSMLTVQSA